MATLRILSAGAAQAVTERIIQAFRDDTGAEVAASFAAVGAIKARVTRGEPVDLIILTQAMIDELAGSGAVTPGTRIDLGTVGTGVAVRAGTRVPDVTTAESLRAAVLASHKVVCPDPAIATAGKIVMSCLEKLGIEADIRRRLQFFPNGYAAMAWLAASRDAGEIGITQVTEIVPNKGITFAGPLPEAFQMKTVYSAGLAQNAGEPALARDFIARYTGATAEAWLRDAGFELGE